ncbi:MAG: tRNA (guanosine(37)-N1)-methyltransferase TrmD [Pseudomonadota bacterium]
MRFDVITLFPEMVEGALGYGVTGRARERGLFGLKTWNPRNFTQDVHRTVDDRPYGGGPGMVMLAEPLEKVIDAVRTDQRAAGLEPAPVIYLSPQGRMLTHAAVMELAARPAVTLLAGRYEGVDERLLARRVDEELSIGDYVLSGGELAAMVVVDCVVRQLPGALGDEHSANEDSFVDGLLDHPHYTRPETYDGEAVPPVLLSGHHAEIRRWRLKQALGRTWLRRPRLLEQRPLSREEQGLLDEFKAERPEREAQGKE